MASINKITYVLASKLSTIKPYHPENFLDREDPLKRNYNQGKWQGWAEAVQAVASGCEELNPNFNKAKFIEACND